MTSTTTTILKSFCENMRPHVEKFSGPKERFVEGLYETMAATIEQYEDAASKADVREVFEGVFIGAHASKEQQLLQAYAEVCKDVLLSWIYGEDEDESS